MEASEIIPATASPLLLKQIGTCVRIFFKCKATLLNDYYASVRLNKSPYYCFNDTITYQLKYKRQFRVETEGLVIWP